MCSVSPVLSCYSLFSCHLEPSWLLCTLCSSSILSSISSTCDSCSLQCKSGGQDGGRASFALKMLSRRDQAIIETKSDLVRLIVIQVCCSADPCRSVVKVQQINKALHRNVPSFSAEDYVTAAVTKIKDFLSSLASARPSQCHRFPKVTQ